MTMMNGFDARDIDILEEEYFGPPPRFLVEGRPWEDRDDSDITIFGEDSGLPNLKKIKQMLGIY